MVDIFYTDLWLVDVAVFGQKQSPTCHPRCVNIDLSDDVDDVDYDDETYLSYDCEAGFYIQVNNWVRSSQHEYELSVCVGQDKNDDRCDTFLFQLPDVAIFTESLQQLSLVLLDVAGNNCSMIVHCSLKYGEIISFLILFIWQLIGFY